MVRVPRLGMVIPLANEAATVGRFLADVARRLDDHDRVFCVVDEASRDDTRAVVQGIALEEERVVLVWAPENRCVVDAYFSGYRAAYDAGCKWILEMDGGYSHQPEQIPRFIEAMSEGYDYVGGRRFGKGGHHVGSLKRYCISKGGSVLTNLVLGTRMQDMTSGFQCFSRFAMKRVLERGVKSQAHFFQTEIKFLLHDMKWKEVPITYRNPSKSVGTSSLKEAIRNLWKLYRSAKSVVHSATDRKNQRAA